MYGCPIFLPGYERQNVESFLTVVEIIVQKVFVLRFLHNSKMFFDFLKALMLMAYVAGMFAESW